MDDVFFQELAKGELVAMPKPPGDPWDSCCAGCTTMLRSVRQSTGTERTGLLAWRRARRLANKMLDTPGGPRLASFERAQRTGEGSEPESLEGLV